MQFERELNLAHGHHTKRPPTAQAPTLDEYQGWGGSEGGGFDLSDMLLLFTQPLIKLSFFYMYR